MATYSFTAAEVLAPEYSGRFYEVGEPIAPGEVVSIDSDFIAWRAINDDVDLAIASGVAVGTAAVAGRWVAIQTAGRLTVATSALFASVGELLVVAGVAGDCMDAADLAASDYAFLIGWVISTTEIWINPLAITDANGDILAVT